MVERINDDSVSKLSIGRFLDKISSSFSVDVEVDGQTLVVDGSDRLNVFHAKKTIDALLLLSKADDIDERLVDYLIGLSKNGTIDEFMSVGDEVIYTTPTGRPIKAKTLGQRFYIDAIKRSELVICSGPAGSGKTFLGVAMAVKAFRAKEVSKIILCRPAIEAGERLGFLPGDIEEKINPYMRPIYDALETLLGNDLFERYFEKGLIEVSPLAFMRGRNLDDAFVLLDEAQNTTNDQMKMFLTRIGMNCKACVCGDFTQIDLPRGSTNGLRDSIDVLKDIEGISIVSLTESDIVRNPLVQRIVNAYANRDSMKEIENEI